MADNESPSNKRENIGSEELKLSSWLQKRLNERARPLNSPKLNIGLSVFSESDQRIQQSWQKSNRLSKQGLTSALSPIDKLSLFPKALPGIIGRIVSVGASSIYRLLDLPWFRPTRSQQEEVIENDGIATRGVTEVGINPSASEYEVRQASKRRVDGQEYMRTTKTPEVYFERLTSPPISRKKPRNIWEHTPSPVTVQRTPVETESITKIYPPSEDLNQHYPVSGTNRSIGNQMVDREVVPESTMNRQTSSNETNIHSSPEKEDQYGERLAVSDDNIRASRVAQREKADKDISQIYPVKELFYAKPLRAARKILQSLPFVRNNQSEVNSQQITVMPLTDDKQNKQTHFDQVSGGEHISGARVIRLATVEPPDLSLISDVNDIETGDVSTQDPKTILHESRKVRSEKRETPIFAGNDEKGENTGYPVVNIFDNKRSQVTQGSVQPLPPGNISRKVTRRPEPEQHRVEKPEPRQAVQGRTDRMIPRQPVRHRIDEVLPQQTISSSDNKKPPRQSIQRHTDEKQAQEPNQRSVEESSSHETAQFHDDSPLMEINSSHQPEKNFDTQLLYERGAGSVKPMQKLPLISRSINPIGTDITRKTIIGGDLSKAIPEFGRAASHSLNLPLAPVNRFEVVQKQDEYPRASQINEGLTIFRSTQNTQSTQTASSTETSQISEEDSTEASTQSDERKTTDYRIMARELYPFIRRMIMIERERMLPR